LIGSIRRECLNHVLVLGERHLRHTLTRYFAYYHQTRTHPLSTKTHPTSGGKGITTTNPPHPGEAFASLEPCRPWPPIRYLQTSRAFSNQPSSYWSPSAESQNVRQLSRTSSWRRTGRLEGLASSMASAPSDVRIWYLSPGDGPPGGATAAEGRSCRCDRGTNLSASR
jgi:hypothetical protein